jgi:sugar phosphate isomerase/epimerase
MAEENEPPGHIVEAKKWIVYVEIAEKEQRTLPGIQGDDFKPYFEALKSINYRGPVVIEGRPKNFARELPPWRTSM